MTAALPDPVRNILDDGWDDALGYDSPPPAVGWTPQVPEPEPPPLPDYCWHRDEIAYEHALAHAAALRAAADEIRADNEARYQQLFAKAKPKRRPKKAEARGR